MTVVRPLALIVSAVLLPVIPAAAQDTTGTAPTPVARVVLDTPNPSVAVGDSIRLEGRALDAGGRPIPEANIVFRTVGPAQAVLGEDGSLFGRQPHIGFRNHNRILQRVRRR